MATYQPVGCWGFVIFPSENDSLCARLFLMFLKCDFLSELVLNLLSIFDKRFGKRRLFLES